MNHAQTIAILGRQPALGIAELESLYGADAIAPFSMTSCMLNMPASSVDFDRLGGCVRLGTVLATVNSTKWQDVAPVLEEHALVIASQIDGKLSFGISTFDVSVGAQLVAKTALRIKKTLKADGNSVRMVPHKSLSLGSAVVLNNKLHRGGLELLVIANGKQTIIAKLERIQNIDAYSARDRERPMRDAKVGMLPPKLAQIIINLAVGQVAASSERLVLSGNTASAPRTQNSELRTRILDPFCGTGVLLQEATLMDYDVYGSDLEPRMVQYTIDNLAWLDLQYPDVGDYRRIEIGDATNHAWNDPHSITHVAAETYLGQPLSTLPPSDQLSKIMHEVNKLHHQFLYNLSQQITSGTRICLAIPTWRGKREFLHLSVLDYLDDLGYNRIDFEYAAREQLIYHRENQVVGRELLVLIKK